MRNKRLDIIKAIGIILVVIGHSGSSYSSFIYIFHLPLFLFVSGFLTYGKNNENKNIIKVIGYKAKKILIPYLVFWVSSMIIYTNLFYIINFGRFEMFGINEIKGLLLGGRWLSQYSNNVPIWYLLYFFFLSVAYEMLNRIIKKDKHKIILMIILLLITVPYQKLFSGDYIFTINALPVGLFFMYFGYFFNKAIKKNNYKNIFNNAYLGIFIVFIGWFVSSFCHGNIAFIGRTLYYLAAIFMILGIYILSGFFTKSKILTHIGKNTIYILGFHQLFMDLVNDFMKYFFTNTMENNPFITHLIVSTLKLILCLGIIELISIVKEELSHKKRLFKRIKNIIE